MQRIVWSAALAAALVGGCAKHESDRASTAVAGSDAVRHGAGFAAGRAGGQPVRPLTTPLYFEPNVGQADAQARYVARGPGFQLLLTSTGAVFKLAGRTPCTGAPCAARSAPASDIVRMAFSGANPSPGIEGLEAQQAHSNYFIGQDPARWHRNVGRFAKVRYRGVYPGVDVVFYGNAQALEYDFVVAPHADTGAIAFDLGGVRDVRVDGAGNLVMRTPHGTLQQHKPTVYQELHGQRVPVDGRYAMLGNGRVGFALGAHDASAPVVIDPMFGFSTYLGGTGQDAANAVATDTEGNTYVVGTTESMDMVPGQTHQVAANTSSAFVTKFDPIGNVVYTTYVGGTQGRDAGSSIAVDATGRAYVAGAACSADFPLVNAAQAYLGGMCDAFVARLSTDGSALEYSTYAGGSGMEPYAGYDPMSGPPAGVHIAIDSGGSAYITGGTSSLDFPVTNALQPAHAVDPSYVGYPDAFVAKLAPDGSYFVYATYLGGTRGDASTGIAVDANGNAYIAGRTGSPDFPLASPLQGTFAGADGYEDAFVAEISSDGSSLVYSTYLGGGFFDRAEAIAVDGEGNAYVAGDTNSPDFPISVYPGNCTPPESPSYMGKAFVAKIAALGQGLAYSACLDGATPYAIALDAAGNAFLTGQTATSRLPLANPMQAVLNPGDNPSRDAFVSTLAADGASLLFSTYLGGNYADAGNGIAVDGAGTIHVVGTTSATDFPTTNGSVSTENSQAEPDSIWNGFVATIQPGVEISIADFHVVEGNDTHDVTFNVHLSSASTEPVTFDLDTVDFDPASWAATEGVDYAPLHARGIVIPPGETDHAVTLTIYGDTTPESGAPTYLAYPGESFMVMFGNVTGAVVRDYSAVGTIGNDDAQLSIGGLAVAEGASGQNSTATMVIYNLARSVLPVSFDYTVTGVTATANSDFYGSGGHVTLQPGQDAAGPSITIVGDDTIEPDETVQVAFSNVVNATPAQGSGLLTILNDDTTLSIADASIVEGNSGTKALNFTVSLAQPTVVPVTFNVATANGTAVAGSDYTATSLAASIPVGSKSVIVAVPVAGDTAIENNETFKVVVSNVVGATVARGTATGTILNDDTKLSIADVVVNEGISGTKATTFTVKLSNVSALPVTFNVATANKTALAGSDYAALGATALSIPAGSTSKTFSVGIIGDRVVEPDETFLVNVSGVKNAQVADAQAVGTIRNDDAALSIADMSIAEGNSGTKTLVFTVKLSAPLPAPLTLSVATANKTALAGSDYLALNLTGQAFPAGTTSKTFAVTIKGDTLREANETFLFNLPAIAVPAGLSVSPADTQAVGTIVNDD